MIAPKEPEPEPRKNSDSFDALVGQGRARNYLEGAWASGRLPHALLFVGQDGVGKFKAAQCLAECILGRAPHAVAKLRSGNHPDFRVLVRDEGKTMVRLDQLRELQSELISRASEGDRHVVIIPDAHLLPADAQDVLLKTLEEPPTPSVFVLITHQVEWLRETVRSRCHMVRFGGLMDEELLTIAEGQGWELPESFPIGLASGRAGLLRDLLEEGALWPRGLWVRILRNPERTGAVHEAARLIAWGSQGLESPEGKSKTLLRDRVHCALGFLGGLARDAFVLRAGYSEGRLFHEDVRESLVSIECIESVEDVDDLLEKLGQSRRALALNISPRLVVEDLILWLRWRFAA